MLILLITLVAAQGPSHFPDGHTPCINDNLCVPYMNETRHQTFFRLGRMFKLEDCMQRVHGLEDMSLFEALDLYGLGQ